MTTKTIEIEFDQIQQIILETAYDYDDDVEVEDVAQALFDQAILSAYQEWKNASAASNQTKEEAPPDDEPPDVAIAVEDDPHPSV